MANAFDDWELFSQLLKQPKRLSDNETPSRNPLGINHPLAESHPVPRAIVGSLPFGGILSGYTQEDLATLSDKVPEERILGPVTNKDFAKFGLALDAADFIPGVAAVGAGAGLAARFLRPKLRNPGPLGRQIGAAGKFSPREGYKSIFKGQRGLGAKKQGFVTNPDKRQLDNIFDEAEDVWMAREKKRGALDRMRDNYGQEDWENAPDLLRVAMQKDNVWAWPAETLHDAFMAAQDIPEWGPLRAFVSKEADAFVVGGHNLRWRVMPYSQFEKFLETARKAREARGLKPYQADPRFTKGITEE